MQDDPESTAVLLHQILGDAYPTITATAPRWTPPVPETLEPAAQQQQEAPGLEQDEEKEQQQQQQHDAAQPRNPSRLQLPGEGATLELSHAPSSALSLSEADSVGPIFSPGAWDWEAGERGRHSSGGAGGGGGSPPHGQLLAAVRPAGQALDLTTSGSTLSAFQSLKGSMRSGEQAATPPASQPQQAVGLNRSSESLVLGEGGEGGERGVQREAEGDTCSGERLQQQAEQEQGGGDAGLASVQAQPLPQQGLLPSPPSPPTTATSSSLSAVSLELDSLSDVDTELDMGAIDSMSLHEEPQLVQRRVLEPRVALAAQLPTQQAEHEGAAPGSCQHSPSPGEEKLEPAEANQQLEQELPEAQAFDQATQQEEQQQQQQQMPATQGEGHPEEHGEAASVLGHQTESSEEEGAPPLGQPVQHGCIKTAEVDDGTDEFVEGGGGLLEAAEELERALLVPGIEAHATTSAAGSGQGPYDDDLLLGSIVSQVGEADWQGAGILP